MQTLNEIHLIHKHTALLSFHGQNKRENQRQQQPYQNGDEEESVTCENSEGDNRGQRRSQVRERNEAAHVKGPAVLRRRVAGDRGYQQPG